MLLTKFFLPELRPNRVARPRLLERLKQATHAPLVIVSAPAGFGKTSLISEWVRIADLRTAWISLDESDNDPARFWMAVTNAMETLLPGVGKNALDLLSSRQPPAVQSLLTSLLNDLAMYTRVDNHLPPACLVLDDIHQLTNPAIHEGLLFFIERLPHQLQLVMVGRSDPPLALGRLRASGRLLEIRAADLRFSLQESQEFLNGVMGLPLSQAQVQELDTRTEGWIAGLQLAGLAMQGWSRQREDENLGAFIQNFSGDDRFILDYLVEEVLSRLPDEVRDFLLQTSILDHLCGALCDAITALPQGSGQSMLEQLERDNLFLIPLDNHRTWYRYHHLFADLLRHQLERRGTGMVEDLHRRAAAWMAGQDMMPEAIEHALRAKDYAAAADWIEAYGQQAIAQGEYTTLGNWIEAIPETVLYARPQLLMHYAWAMNYLAQIDRYEQVLAAAERLWREQHNPTGLADVLNLRADFAASIGEGPKAGEFARQALELLPDEDAYRRGISWMYLGSAAFLQGDMQAASEALNTGKSLCERSGNLTGARQAAMMLAQVFISRANLPEAARLLEEIRAQTGKRPIYEGLMAGLLLGGIWREWNRLEEAETLLRRVLDSAAFTGQGLYFHLGYLYLAQILIEKGDFSGMQAALAQHAALAEEIGGERIHKLHVAFRAYLSLLSGNSQEAERWVADLVDSPDEPVGFLNEFYHLILVRVWIRQRAVEMNQILDLLENLTRVAQSQQRTGSLVEISMLRALVLEKLGDHTAAVAALEQALMLAQPGGYRRIFLDEGRPLYDLLVQLARSPTHSPNLRNFIAELRNLSANPETPQDTSTAQATNQALIEPLTPRELEVLRLIQNGLSNREIADELYLSLNTVKVHVKNIFGRLEVSSRTQAVRRAEELGLI